MAKWGLGYSDLVKIKPDIIMFSTCQQGQTGPHASLAALGTQLVSLAGFTYLTGWPDRPPTGPYGPYTDIPAPYFATTAILAALRHRRKTGRGIHIDIAQFETAIQFLAPLVLDYFANGTVAERMGNRCHYAAPHGAFRCKGEDRWCFIAVYTDDEWKALCQVMGEPDWTRSERFATFLSRKRNEDELELLVANWTANFDAYELMQKLQDASVPAGVLQTGEDLHNDPQLKHRHYLHQLEHPEIGRHSYEGLPFKLSKTTSEFKMPAPLLGQHTEYVCTKILGMSDEEFVALMAEGVFE
jgi:crotonobetainyl-CoA:carnitine CoA-transferase CaiB-like acyl-CoA transferase